MKRIYATIVLLSALAAAQQSFAQCNITIAMEIDSPVSCFATNGSIDVLPMSGTPPFSYLWSNNSTSSSISGLGPGRYILVITDSANCVRLDTFDFTAKPVVTAGLVQPINCFGASTGSIKASGLCGQRASNGNYYQYLWYKVSGSASALLSGQTDSIATGLDAGVYYAVIKDLNNDTARSADITLTQPSRIVPAAGVTAVTCNGGSNGSVVLSATGGGGSYTYALGSGAYGTSGSFSGLGAGSYVFHVKDAQACIRDTTLNITQPAALGVTVSATQVSCFGGSNGSITVTATGGTPGYTYARDAGAYSAAAAFTALTAGTYVIHTKDAAGCIKDTTVTITQPSRIIPAASVTGLSCNGASTGTVTISATGGVGGYTYAKDAGAYGNSGTFTSLAAGTYVFHVKDASGCIRDTSITLTQSLAIVPTATVTNVSCNGGSNGLVALSATGGSGAFTYARGTGPYGTSGTFSGLGAGTYVFYIKDAAACVKDTIITVTQPLPISPMGTTTQVSCFGSNNGSISMTASGGTPPYTYAKDAGPYSTSPIFTGLTAGSYVIHIKDAAACSVSSTIIITQPPRIVPGAAVTPVSCNGAATGAVSLSATGGSGSYTYAKDAGTYGSSALFTALTAGAYVFHVKDAAGCIRDTLITITQPAAIIPAATVTNVSCNGGSNGSVTLSATGGSGGFTYARGTGPYGTSGTFSGLGAGTYVFYIKDAAACVKDTTITLTQPSSITATPTTTQVSCFGGNNGSISVSASGGTPPYTYAKDAGAYGTSAVFTGLAAGTYVIHTKDAAACSVSTTVVITQPTRIVPGATVTPVSCNGAATGAVNLSATGGGGSYTYAKDAGAYGSSALFTALTAGAYVFHVKDAVGCIQDTLITITQPSQIVPIATVTNVSCNGGNNASVTLNASGGTGAFTYAQGTGAYVTSGVFNGLSVGTYLFHIKDANGCVRDTTLLITQPAPLTVALTATPVSCFRGTNGSTSAIVTGGTAPYHFEWSSGDTLATLNGIKAGAYFLAVKDARGCETQATVTVSSPDSIRLTSIINKPSCHGLCNGSINLQPTGGTAPYNYQWSNNAVTEDLSNLCAGTYSLTLTDAAGCTASAVFSVAQPAAVMVNAGPDRVLCKTGSVTITVEGTDTATYQWTSSLPGFSADSSSVVVSQPATYYVTATKSGCVARDTVVVTQTASDIQAEFVAATQAFKDSLYSVVNISSPEPDNVEWRLPATTNVVVVSRSKHLAELIFRDTGTYMIGMIARSGQCEKLVESKVIVVEGQPYAPVTGDPRRAYIKAFTIAPNPNSGRFNVHIELDEEGPVRLRLLSLQSSGAASDRQDGGKKLYDFSYDLTLQSGQYLLLLETARGSQTLKLTVQ